MEGSRLAVQLENIHKSFGEQHVLIDVSLEIRTRSVFCILGRSGTGKSVILKQMIGLIRPDRGRVVVAGRNLAELDSRGLAEVRRKIGFLFQNAALFDSITVGENVAFPLRRQTDYPEQKIAKIVRKRLSEVGLEAAIDKMPSSLSGGMRKRAGLARALALEPEILLVDEPSSGLDPLTSDEIDLLLLDLKTNENVTIVMVTHNMHSAKLLADEMAVIHEGRVVALGTTQDLKRSEHPLVKHFMSYEGMSV